MNCAGVRDQLPEHALDGLGSHDALAVERHLAWCAACRKEARDLQQAAAVMSHALPPASPPDELEERVVEAVRREATRGRLRPRRRALSVLASVTAAAVALAGLGWGAVMADRAERFEERVAEEQRRRQISAARFADFLDELPGRTEEDEARFGTLTAATGEQQGAGHALVFVSPRIKDFAVVIVSGIDPAEVPLPLRVRLVGARGGRLAVGRIAELDADGSATAYREFRQDLGSFTTVAVEDASGAILLRGRVEADATPSP